MTATDRRELLKKSKDALRAYHDVVYSRRHKNKAFMRRLRKLRNAWLRSLEACCPSQVYR
jgi:hypothetical protein